MKRLHTPPRGVLIRGSGEARNAATWSVNSRSELSRASGRGRMSHHERNAKTIQMRKHIAVQTKWRMLRRKAMGERNDEEGREGTDTPEAPE
jgi:hypothetical protein